MHSSTHVLYLLRCYIIMPWDLPIIKNYHWLEPREGKMHVKICYLWNKQHYQKWFWKKNEKWKEITYSQISFPIIWWLAVDSFLTSSDILSWCRSCFRLHYSKITSLLNTQSCHQLLSGMIQILFSNPNLLILLPRKGLFIFNLSRILLIVIILK